MKVTTANVFALIDMVNRMRSAQRQYHVSKTNERLRIANDLERRVDALLNEIRHGDVQGLFDNLQTEAKP